MITGTVCGLLLLIGVAITVLELVHPTVDTTNGITALGSVVSTLLGAVLGLIAGHAQALRRQRIAATLTPEIDP